MSEFRIGQSMPNIQSLPTSLETPRVDSGGFGSMLKGVIDQANDMQIQADGAAKEMIGGRTKNLHEAMLAIEKADISLKLMMQVRNKVLEAYKEVMRMQV